MYLEAAEHLILPAEVIDGISSAATVEELQASMAQAVSALVMWVLSWQTLTFFAFETPLVPQVLALGRLCLQLFLRMREAQWQAAAPLTPPGYKRQGPIARQLGTFFGKVGYVRTYFYRSGGGDYPLDIKLGLPRDGFSLLLASHGCAWPPRSVTPRPS